MKLSHEFLKRAAIVAVLTGTGGGCGDEASASDCAEENRVGGPAGVCAGITAAPLCSDDVCSEGVTCSTIVTATNNTELNTALAGASAATCVTLTPGTYGAASLPPGVSLLGRSATEVTVEGVTLAAGKGAVVRGLTVGASGMKINGSTDVAITSVLVSGSADAGIDVAAGSSVTITGSTIRNSSRYGVKIADGADVHIESSIIEASQGPGLWSACSSECAACPAPPKVSVESSIVRENHLAGIALFTTTLELHNVDILRTKPGDTWHAYEGGGGLSAASCSSLTASALRVHNSARFGLLIDASNAAVGSESAAKGDIDIRGNLIGAWVQNVEATQSVILTQTVVDENSGIGVGTSGETRGFIFCNSLVQNTKAESIAVKSDGLPIGSQMVGDGFVWSDGSEVTLDSIEFRNSARASVLIDGPAQGSIQNVQLSGGDEQKGMLIQNVGAADMKPSVDKASPPLIESQQEQFDVPVAPQSPTPNL